MYFAICGRWSSRALYMRLLFILATNILFPIVSCYCDVYTNKSEPHFGRHMRKYFYLDPDFIQMNHGSFGTYPLIVYKTLREYQDRSNKHPGRWYRREVISELAKVRRIVGQQISADPEDIVIVPNTTNGIADVFRSWIFSAGDRLLIFSTIYDGILGFLRFIVDRSQGSLSFVVFNVTYPMTTKDFLRKFEEFLTISHTSEKPITMAVIDHITSMPSIILPLDKMISMLKKRNIISVVDGAHAYGQVPINITALDPDFYVTNGHKWGYTARSTAILYVKKEHQKIIHPVTTSHFYSDPSDFQREFYWTGTIDYSAYMTYPAALKFRKQIGGEQAIMNYIHNLAWEGGQRMADILGTQIIQYKDQTGGMVGVQLPVSNPNDPKLSVNWWLDAQVYTPPGTYTPIYYHNGQWLARVSAQVYMDITDFEVHAKHLLAICNKLNNPQNNTVPTTCKSTGFSEFQVCTK